MKRVVMTGATGTIGMALIQRCIKEETEVIVLCHKNSKRVKLIPENSFIKLIECNLEELALFSLDNVGYDVFYHFAWEATWGNSRNNVEIQMKNIQYTLDAVKLAYRLKCRRFIGAGSQAEYGRYEGTLQPDTPAFPENGYGIAKLCAGQLSKLLCEQLGIDCIWVRVLSVYGPYDGMDTMVSSVTRSFLKQEHVSLTEGEQVWDYLYSGDAAKAFYLLGTKGKVGKTYVLSGGYNKKLKDYIEIIKEKTGYHDKPGYGEIPYTANQVMYLSGNISELTQDTGFIPETDFEEGIEYVIEWVKGVGL